MKDGWGFCVVAIRGRRADSFYVNGTGPGAPMMRWGPFATRGEARDTKARLEAGDVRPLAAPAPQAPRTTRQWCPACGRKVQAGRCTGGDRCRWQEAG